MGSGRIFGLLLGVMIGAAAARSETLVTAEEIKAKEQWVREKLLGPDGGGVSFMYGEKKSGELLKEWGRTVESKPLEGGRTKHVLRWEDARTGLEVRVVAVEYGDYPAVEWTGYLKNTGKADTPLLKDVRAIDMALGQPKQQAILRTIRGDNCTAESYEPLAVKVEDKPIAFAPVGGRPSNSAFPYFNLDFGTEGVILALGWPGQWAAQFAREAELVQVRGGQELTHLKLKPGEEIRTPLVAILFWKGKDWVDGQNLWRRWMVAHNLPRPGGKLPGQFTARGTDLHQSAAGDKATLEACLNAGVKYDYWWIDAGWYEGPDWWSAKGVGTWTPDPIRFPKGIREVADYVHDKGMKLILWFEPERVFKGSWLWENHPDWLLKLDENNKQPNDNRLLNLGNSEARQWLTEYISTFIAKEGVDLYRQDHNVDPLSAWRNYDEPERQGMTENLYVDGYLAYWDALLQRHPDMLIDSCASGGRRNDLETLRRSAPLLRSDFMNGAFMADPAIDIGNQCHTYGLSLWVPYYGTGMECKDIYAVRSHLCPAMVMVVSQGKWDELKQRLADYQKVADYFYGDYYPLTAYSRGQDVWMAWEFIRPEQGDGMVQVFRRAESPYQAAQLRMHGLKSEVRYVLTDIDTGKTREESGKTLMNEGLPVVMPEPRAAIILTFQEKH